MMPETRLNHALPLLHIATPTTGLIDAIMTINTNGFVEMR